MAKNELRLTGTRELRDAFARLPTDLRDDSDPTLLAFATRSKAAVVSTYPSITGNLRAQVQLVRRTARGIAAFYQLVSGATYAHIFEFGGKRQRPRPVFLRITDRDRRAAVVAVADQVEDAGLVVEGARD